MYFASYFIVHFFLSAFPASFLRLCSRFNLVRFRLFFYHGWIHRIPEYEIMPQKVLSKEESERIQTCWASALGGGGMLKDLGGKNGFRDKTLLGIKRAPQC